VVADSVIGGTIQRRYRYAPYGESLNLAAGTFMDGLGYTGHEMDADTGLTYMQQRYYDPKVGRFLSADPVGVDASTGGNFSRYWYANNNPYKFTDPDGRQSAADNFGDAVARDPEAFNNSLHQVPALIVTGVMLVGPPALMVAGEYSGVMLAAAPALNGAGGTALDLVAGDAIGGATVAVGTAKAVEGAYEIVDGVRRSKAAEMLGNAVIDAVDTTGKKIMASIDSLFSPYKDKIDVSSSAKMDRFMSVLEGVKAEKTPPILVTPGSRGTPIRDVDLDSIGE
jgi:RHS repeat-associated protein